MTEHTLMLVMFALDVAMLAAVAVGLTVLTVMFVRQREDLRQGILLQAAMDDDQRVMRHAIKDIAYSLNMKSVAESLMTPAAIKDPPPS